jgi:hypothetical protein
LTGNTDVRIDSPGAGAGWPFGRKGLPENVVNADQEVQRRADPEVQRS